MLNNGWFSSTEYSYFWINFEWCAAEVVEDLRKWWVCSGNIENMSGEVFNFGRNLSFFVIYLIFIKIFN